MTLTFDDSPQLPGVDEALAPFRAATAERQGSHVGDDRAAQVFAYYFPQWHVDPRNEDMLGAGWTEWDVLRPAQPRFPGHRQPRRPLWGEADESDPAVASRAVGAALDHEISGFIVDWYWYDNAPFLNRYLDEGLLHADRLDEFQFGLMWANHDWTELYPAAHGNPGTLLPAPRGRYHAEQAFDHILEHYLGHPSYWRIDGAAYFSIYDLPGLISGMGGPIETARLLDSFRRRAQDAGVGELHLNGVLTPQVPDPRNLLPNLGFDSGTHYTWWHHADQEQTFPNTPYSIPAADAERVWDDMTNELEVPYIPNVTVGWDPTPRTIEWAMDRDAGYPFTTVLTDGTPELYGAALEAALEHVNAGPSPRYVSINAWNEWTEGSYLEPDETDGFGYLEATATAIRRARASDKESRS